MEATRYLKNSSYRLRSFVTAWSNIGLYLLFLEGYCKNKSAMFKTAIFICCLMVFIPWNFLRENNSKYHLILLFSVSSDFPLFCHSAYDGSFEKPKSIFAHEVWSQFAIDQTSAFITLVNCLMCFFAVRLREEVTSPLQQNHKRPNHRKYLPAVNLQKNQNRFKVNNKKKRKHASSTIMLLATQLPGLYHHRELTKMVLSKNPPVLLKDC